MKVWPVWDHSEKASSHLLHEGRTSVWTERSRCAAGQEWFGLISEVFGERSFLRASNWEKYIELIKHASSESQGWGWRHNAHLNPTVRIGLVWSISHLFVCCRFGVVFFFSLFGLIYCLSVVRGLWICTCRKCLFEKRSLKTLPLLFSGVVQGDFIGYFTGPNRRDRFRTTVLPIQWRVLGKRLLVKWKWTQHTYFGQQYRGGWYCLGDGAIECGWGKWRKLEVLLEFSWGCVILMCFWQLCDHLKRWILVESELAIPPSLCG